MAPRKPKETEATGSDAIDAAAEAEIERQVETAEAVTAEAAAEDRLPENAAIANPAPATELDSASGAFIEPAIVQGVPVDHPSVDNNPRRGTSAIQNGADFNDPTRRTPDDPKFVGQGLDRSVYGAQGE